MAHDLESALAACEALLRQGASLEECLERFPEHREALEPLLSIYQVSRRTWDETPPPSREGLHRARTRFLAEAARLREAEQAPSKWSRLFAGLVSLTTSRGLAIAAYVLVFFTVAVTVTAVAQGALPGDPLYPVKRHSEDVVMFLDKSEVLRERFDQRRLDEVEMLTERAPDQKITISGEVDRVEGLSFRVGGVPVQVPQEMRDRIPAEGARVQVVGVPREDHILLIEAPLVKATPPRSTPQTIMIVAPATATPTATPTATAMPSKTATATITASVTASATATPEATIAPARTDMPTATATATHTATATQTVTPTSTMTHTPVPTETHTPQPPPRPITVRIEGCIQQLEAERWRVEGRWVQVPANRFSLERASAVVGGGVVIRAVERPDGRLEAEAIAIQDPQLREFNGAIEEIAQDYWRVAGRIVHIDVATEVIGERILGVRAQVAADEYCDGRLRARRISIVAEPEILMGRVLSIAGDHWVLARSDKPDGQRVSFNQATEVHGEVVVGATVQVTAVKLADGSLLARSLHVLAGPPPTRTPTAVPPTATSTPTEDVATSTPEVKGDSNQDLVEPTPSPVLDTATAEPTAQPSSTDDLQDAALDPTPSTRDKSQAESDAAVMAEAEGDEIEASPAPALCPTPMPGA